MITIQKTKQSEGFEVIEKKEKLNLEKNEVQIKMIYSSICGTDVHIYKWDEWAQKTIKTPHVNGHEGVGMVEKIGENVKNFEKGDFVVYETHYYCSECHICKLGNIHVCKNMTILGVHLDGVWSEKIFINKNMLFKIPKNSKIPIKYCGVLEPVGNAEHTLRKTESLKNKNVLIMGDGPIGIFAALIAIARGSKRVFLTGINDVRLTIAKKCDIKTIDTRKYQGQELDKYLKTLTENEGIDVIGEFTGVPSVLQDAVRIINPGGDINILSIYKKNDFNINMNDLVLKDISMNFTCGRRIFESWENSFNFLNEGKISLKHIDNIITHSFKLKDFKKGFDAILNNEAGKVLLEISPID